MKYAKSILWGALLAAMPSVSFAQDAVEEESESNFSWNAALTSDYVFRGITQTDRKPALQAGVDYAFGDSGFYVGAWGSNVDYGDGSPNIEIDVFAGYNIDFADKWNADIGITRYTYHGADSGFGDIDYNELIGKIAYDEMLTFVVGYADDYSNAGFSQLYYGLEGSWDIGHDFSLNAGVGHTDFRDNNGKYNDWNIGVSRAFGPVEVAVGYYDTDERERVSDSVVLTLSIGG